MTSTPIRLLHVITGLNTGGAETMLLKILQGMDRGRFSSTVLSLTDEGQIGPRISELGFRVETLGMRRRLPDPFSFLSLVHKMRRIRPHVVQTWLYHADLLGCLASRMAGQPPVAWNLRCSYMGADYYRGMSGLVIRSLARLSDLPAAVVYNSEAGRALHVSLGYEPQRWVLIPNGFDTQQMHPDPDARRRIRGEIGVANDAPLVGMVARFDTVKGHDTFLAAAGRLLRSRPEAKFLLVGAGCTTDNAELRRMMPKAIQDAVILLGERRDIPDVNAAIDVATCASIGEGFPNVVGEAMACGVPVVTTDVGDCAEIVDDMGRVVPPQDSEAMANAWNEILSLPAAAHTRLSMAARARINESYALNDVVVRYEQLYGELAGATSS